MSKWKRIKLEEACILNMGQSPDSASYNEEGEGLPFYQGNADFGDLHPKARYYCSKPTKIAHKNDVLISVRAPIGAVNIATEECCIGRGLAALTPLHHFDYKYLYYVIKNKNVELNLKGTGSTFTAINRKSLAETMINFPPLEEQKRIADILDKASNLIELRKQQLEKMDLLIKSKFIDMFGDPVTNPKGWDMKKISDVCIINPRKTELGSIPDDLEVSFIPMASVSEKGDIRTNEIKKYSEVKTGFTYFHEGDVLFAKITPCMENGKGAIAINLKNLIGFGSTEFHVIRPIENITNSEWIFNLIGFKWLREDAEKNMTGSAGQRRVPASYFEKCKVSVPPLELQTQFAEFVEQVEKQKAVMQQSLEKMETNYKALMQQYFG